MKSAVKTSNILSWINIIFWGFIVLLGLLVALAAHNMAMLIGCFFASAVILHSYAALQLHKSILHPEIPLASRTSSGLRFIGIAALLSGILTVVQSINILQNIPEMVKAGIAQMPDQFKHVDLSRLYIGIALFTLLIGLCVVVNVFINLRILRWYYQKG